MGRPIAAAHLNLGKIERAPENLERGRSGLSERREKTMSARETVVLFIHGANQGGRSEDQNTQTWEKAFNVDKHASTVRSLIVGEDNDEIRKYHEQKHQGCDYPQYRDWTAPWYGDVWANLAAQDDPFDKRLNQSSDKENEERGSVLGSVLEGIERKGMQKHFDELVPFYELAVQREDGKTLYEAICNKFLSQLIPATAGGKSYVLIGHSMGCAVTYNVMTHISCAESGIDYCPIEGTLSTAYREKVTDFAASDSKCFGLMTFGNYTGYNWCQRLNNRLLFGESKKQYVYPNAVGRWFNFWTVLGGDPYIIDDQLGDDIVDDEQGQYDDVLVLRTPGLNIGHGRDTWFQRSQFAKKLRRKMAHHLYL